MFISPSSWRIFYLDIIFCVDSGFFVCFSTLKILSIVFWFASFLIRDQFVFSLATFKIYSLLLLFIDLTIRNIVMVLSVLKSWGLTKILGPEKTLKILEIWEIFHQIPCWYIFFLLCIQDYWSFVYSFWNYVSSYSSGWLISTALYLNSWVHWPISLPFPICF